MPVVAGTSGQEDSLQESSSGCRAVLSVLLMGVEFLIGVGKPSGFLSMLQLTLDEVDERGLDFIHDADAGIDINR